MSIRETAYKAVPLLTAHRYMTATTLSTGTRVSARVISDQFAGKLTVARHRMVYKALGKHMDSDIHALALETLTTDED